MCIRDRYSLGLYYYKNSKIEEAMGIYSRIIIECPKTKLVDYAKIEFAEIYISKGRYEDAVNKLSEIKNKKLRNRKNSMLILSYYNLNKNKKALALTNKELYRLLKSPHGEAIMKANLIHFYDKNNINQFTRFSKYLARYSGNDHYINYYTGKIYYNIKNYRKSYYYFYKLSQVENHYQSETFFYLAKISLFIYRNKKNSVKYFIKTIESNNESEFSCRARINLAILYHEMKQKTLSKDALLQVIKGPNRGLYNTQAKNLYELYGYN